MDWLSNDDIDREMVSLQFGRWGFRIDGSALYSFSSKEEARNAFRQIKQEVINVK
jgi:hypothetical protein